MANAALSGRKTVTSAGTPEALGSGDVFGGLYIKALIANTGTIEVGSSATAAASGFQLSAGDVILFDYVNDMSQIYIDSTVNGEGVSWLRTNISRM